MEYFRLGDYVEVASNNDNDCYDSFRNKKLKIIHISRNTNEHPGYDDSMEGIPLYDLQDVETGEIIEFSLYFYELQQWIR